jgi:Flp pilus assembly CpaE family ATPase
MQPRRQESGHLEVAQIEKTLGKKVAYEIPDDWKTVSSAINIGSPLSEIAPKSRVRAAIREIAQTIAHEQTGSPATKAEGKTGLLGRLFTAAT